MKNMTLKRRLLAFMICLTVALGLISEQTTVVAATPQKVTVGTQKELDKALKKKAVLQITLSSSKATSFTIKKGDYGKKKLIVQAPKATITNEGIFQKIYFESDKTGSGKWIEKGKNNNQFIVRSKNAVIDVVKNATVKSISVDKKQSQVTVNRTGTIVKITLKKASELVINSKQNESSLNVVINAKNCKVTDLSSVAYLKNQSEGKAILQTNAGELTVKKGYEGTTKELIKQYLEQEENSEDDESEDDDSEDSPSYWGSEKDIQKAKTILSQIIKPGMSDYAKVQSVYKWLIDNVEYDWSMQPRSYTAEGALFYGKAVCSGYAGTFQLFMALEGIESKFVSGTLDGQGHAWNLVLINGNWYHLDATLDAGKKDIFDCRNFLRTDAEIRANVHDNWDSELPVANHEADFWSEYIELAGDELVKMNTPEEVEKYFNQFTEPGTYELVLYSDIPLWNKVNIHEYMGKRKDVLSYLSIAAWRHCGSYYFCRYAYVIEIKYDQVSDTNPELTNFVQNEAEMADKLDKLITNQQDLVFTCNQSSDLRNWLMKWADQRGYYCNQYLLNNGITYETLHYEYGDLNKVTIPRKCIQCSPGENSIDVGNLDPGIGNIKIVNTKEKFESLVAPLFQNGQANSEFNENVVPAWECSEEDIMAMLNEMAGKYGYKSVKLISPMTKTRVSYSNYCFHLYAAQFICLY